ncbi:hypothetical protein [Onishia niordana]|uniref:hypothetical protein n=1 Tax=Onishia niordana TaxID=2508711 RepID=UPI00109FB7EC|nr:hypothetical protein [Halomonas niordiana]
MSVNETFDGYYADTAYTPDQRRNWEEENPEREKIFGSRLSWDRKTQDTGPKEMYDPSHIEMAEVEEEKRQTSGVEGEAIFKQLKARYDHQAMMPPNYKTTAVVFYMATAFGKGFSYISAIGFVFFLLIYLLYLPTKGFDFKDYLEVVEGFFFLLSPIFLASVFFWKVGDFLEKKRPDIFLGLRKGPVWKADRQTGNLTLYNPKKAWKKRVEAPFYEFDAYLQSSPDTQGSATYTLILHHPKTGVSQKMKSFFPSTKMQGELIAGWHFLQRYMDVSQPLPDVPGLEIHRHKDPTTAKADKRRRRNPRFWRDKTEGEIKKIQEDKYRKNIRLR